MSLYRDKAIVLRTYDLREADRIIVMMTEEHGKVRAVANGVRKMSSRCCTIVRTQASLTLRNISEPSGP